MDDCNNQKMARPCTGGRGGREHQHCRRTDGVARRLLQWVRGNTLAAPWATRTGHPEKNANHDANAAEQGGNVVYMSFEPHAPPGA